MTFDMKTQIYAGLKVDSGLQLECQFETRQSRLVVNSPAHFNEITFSYSIIIPTPAMRVRIRPIASGLVDKEFPRPVTLINNFKVYHSSCFQIVDHCRVIVPNKLISKHTTTVELDFFIHSQCRCDWRNVPST